MRELISKYIVLLTSVLIVMLSVLFAMSQNRDETDTKKDISSALTIKTIALDSKKIHKGKKLFSSQGCARCHSVEGKGNKRNPLDSVGDRLNEDSLKKWIIGDDSLQDKMSERAFEQKQKYKQLLPDELEALVEYMRSLRLDTNVSIEKEDTNISEKPKQKEFEVGKNGTCLECHSNAGHMMQTVKPKDAPSDDGCAVGPSRPAFLNAFVNKEFEHSTHGKLGCTGCHGGDAKEDDQEKAHLRMVPAESKCVICHSDIVTLHASSLHSTLSGMSHTLKLRSGEDNFHKLGTVWNNDCKSCHAGCADCHIILPRAVGGGLLKGHEFLKKPPMKETCATCHGSRAGAEYLGTHEGLEPDVHFEAGMHCLDCHKNDLHGDGTTYTSRWDVKGRPECTDCHDALPNDSTPHHSASHVNVSCQVCHSQPYQNCFGCHAEMKEGHYIRKTSHKSIDFKIGNNTLKDALIEYTTVRSNPVSRDSFEYFGKNLLPHFDDHPTWKTIAPHNIRRITPQNRSCANCHGNKKLFLQKEDLDENGSKENNAVIPNKVP
ncbi:MAG: hypothetical protein COB07_04650 [Sulfurovum sp.]|nr:MAG: hypothetical protein COB07_04650 [Sulfurovum sp.]